MHPLKRIQNIIVFISLLSFITLGCSTPSYLKPVKWKKEKGPMEYAIEHYEKGLSYEERGEREKAIEEYQAAQKLSPRPIVYYKLGLLYAAEGHYDSAGTNFQKAIELSPTFEEAKKELATILSIRTPVSSDTTNP